MRLPNATIGLLALPFLFLAACEPETAERGTDAEAAEAPPTTRPEAPTTTEAPFAQWDIDQSQTLQREEFAQWARDEGVFDDLIGEDGLDRDGLAERIHAGLDRDGDGTVTEMEWQETSSRLFDNPGTWSDWDADGNAELDTDEVSQGLEGHGLFGEVDADADMTVNEMELGDFLFDALDANDDDALDPAEWEEREGWIEG